ncbi:BREX-1 system adenine-specific DNA-methyltransferase PglX, partial [bacterium]
MNTAALRRYAPAARKDFLRAVTDRAAKVGLSEGKPAVPVTVQGLDAILDGKPYPRAFAAQRRRLEESIAKKGFRVVMEEAAYTWFNRLMAIRYMEVHGYLDHGFRVLSHPEGKPTPQALEQAQNVVLPGLNRQRVIDLKLDGTKDEELYRMLLLAQCRALHQAMPFLFESIDDATELLVPDHLLASDSLVRKMVAEIPESDWQEIEVVGWLYQFYISEEKARVDASVKGGKAVAPEDIPAKTQLFTPKWIVRYMLQNSLGRLWLDIEPNSPLKEGWEYWVEPAEQEPEVRAELERLAAETRAKHPTPETITFIDPCAGSGHILVEAYDLLKSFYEERGYARREIPRLILEKNLFGLEIDDRAAQMAGFALLMRARADDRSILTTPPSLNVLVLQSSEGIDPEAVASALEGGDAPLDSVFAPTSLMPDLDRQPTLTAIRRRPDASLRTLVGDLLDLFEAAKTFGSLIRVPAPVASRLPELVERIESAPQDLLSRENLSEFSSLVRQAEILARRMDVAVTNPPYLEASKVGKELQDWAKKAYPVAKADLWAMFIERCRLSSSGYFALVTMHAW